ncbi:MAG: ABC transporter permease [Ruminococcus sp.]|nr:ABC transporter permease [Ruminococcus sp.]
MKYLTLLRANIKSQRSSFIGILTLVFIITISLLAVLSIWMNANAYENEQIERLGYGDITFWINEIADTDALLEKIGDIEEVGMVTAEDVIFFEQYEVYGEEAQPRSSVLGSLHVQAWTQESGYHIYNENLTGIRKEPEALADGEVYVSPAFASLYEAKIGDFIELSIVEGEETLRYRIKGYFEDPVAGSALMGMKRALVTEHDMAELETLIHEAGEKAMAGSGSAVHITGKKDLALSKLQEILGEKTELLQIPGFSYKKSTITGFMLILQNIFAGFLIVFVLVLMIVAMIIIGHSISSSIEQDYVDMGILKALGYTGRDLRIVQILQYLTAILGGMLPGIPLSMVVVKGIGRVTVTVVGLLIPADIPIAASLLSLGFIILIIMGFVFVRTAKIGRITPIRAIRGGAEDVYFKSRLTAPIHKGNLSFWLAYRQLVAGKKQYVSACFVTALLVFFLSLTVRLDTWLGPDGRGLMESFAAARYDMGVRYEDEGLRMEIEKMLDERAHITDSYQYRMARGFLNQTEYLMNVVSAPEYYNILEGRTCIYDNEMVVTDLVAEELGVSIGDGITLTCGSEGAEREFVISGIYQCANDIGSNFGVTKEGYESFYEEEVKESSYYIFYLLEDASCIAEMKETLEETYGERITIDDNSWSGTDAVLLVTSVLMLFMLIITIVFILVTVSLTGNKILHKEQRDLGIYKSLGFVSEKLRLAFALRFGMTAALGSVMGIVLSAYLTDPLADVILRICGVSHFTSKMDLFRMSLPGVIVTVLFLAFAYLAAGKVKKVEPGILIVE